MKLTTLASAFALFLIVGGSAHAQSQHEALAVDPQKAQNIRTLFKLSTPPDLLPQVMDQFIAAFRQVAPNVPQEFWEKYKQRVNFDELVELVVPIYDKYFTEEDIKVMLDYYNTPTGRKVTATTTQMTKEKMTVMQAWGRKLGTEIERELRQKGIYLQPR